MIGELTTSASIILASIAASFIIWAVSKKLILRSALPRFAKDALSSIMEGPVAVTVVGYGALLAAERMEALSPGLLPAFLNAANLAILVRIAIIISIVQAAASLLRGLFPFYREGHPSSKMPIYGIYAVGAVALIHTILSSSLFPPIPQGLWATINFLTGIFLTYLAVHILNAIMKLHLRPRIAKEPRLETTYAFIRRLALAIIAILGIAAATFTAFPAMGGLIASIFLAAGFASIVIGLAAQTSLSNIIAGMVIATSQPFRIGEAISFRNEFCFVEDIKLIHTTLRTWDNRRLIVPNSLFLSEVVTNYSAEDPTMLVPIYVQISYESDLDRAMEIMRQVALRHPDCMPTDDLPSVVVMDYGESGINLRLLSRAKDQPTAFKMARDLLYQIKKEFDANGIEIPYPRRHLILGREAEEVLRRALGKAGEGRGSGPKA
ncbi:MAG: mechanosensitive ion channel family protein [Candidatus Bathyarchaeia archaeon]